MTRITGTLHEGVCIFMIVYIYIYIYILFFFCCGAATQRGSWPPHSLCFLDHTQRRTTVGRTPLYEWSALYRDLYLTTQHSQQTNIHAPGGIRTHDLCRRTAAGLPISIVVSRWILLRMRNISYKICRENQNTKFMFSKFFLTKNRDVCELMWRHIMWRHTMWKHTMWKHIMWRHTMWRYIMWRHIMWRHNVETYNVETYNVETYNVETYNVEIYNVKTYNVET